MEVYCIKCEEEIKVFHDTFIEGIWFRGSGNYGSIYDLSHVLKVAVCDSCIKTTVDKGLVRKTVKETTIKEYEEIVVDINNIYTNR